MSSAESHLTLQRRVTGEVTRAGDALYADATGTWDLSVRSRPPVALVAASVEDIAEGARWAAENGLGIAVRNTGHGAFSSDQDALVISTARLNRVSVNPISRRARVQPGARWSQVDAATSPHGLVGASGASAGVGVVGYTLGGGLGPLGRTLGFASDRVHGLTVLNADYVTQRVTATEDPELFWALRGGGALGIVTELEFDLAAISSLFGGGIYFDGTHAEAVLGSYAAWVGALDQRTTTSIALIHLPPAPQLPPSLRGRYVVHLRVAHVDPDALDLEQDGRALLRPLLSVAEPIADLTQMMTSAHLPDIHRDPVAPQDVAYRGGFLDQLDATAIATMCELMTTGPDPTPRMIELRHLEGAYAESPLAPSSATGRQARFNLYVTASADPDDHRRARHLVDTTVARISSVPTGQYNFYGPAPEPGKILTLWGYEDAQRLDAAALRLDPTQRIRTGRPLR